jgi:solute carrier family 8 (sodium/calcium exchanger)
MIIAVCIVAIPNGEVRYIKEVPVYVCTASWSIFAYVWLLVVLMGISPNVVELWEGVLTFLFFPILTVIAFAADKGYFGAIDRKENEYNVHEEMSKEELAEASAKVREEHGQHLTDEQVTRILMAVSTKKRTPAQYRIAATRAMCGSRRVRMTRRSLTTKLSKKFSFLGSKRVVPVDDEQEENAAPTSWIQFWTQSYAVLESAGTIDVKVVRGGDVSMAAKAWYNTRDGTANEKSDYHPVKGWLEFKADQTEAVIRVSIIDDNAYEDDEHFYIALSDAENVPSGNSKDKLPKCAVGTNNEVKITIIDDDEAGVLSFEQEEITTNPHTGDYTLPIKVLRRNGGCGEVTVEYATEGASAVAGRDFEHSSGTLKFIHQQVEATIEVTIKAVGRYDMVDTFRVLLTEPGGGAKFDATKDGGADRNIVTVRIAADAKEKERVDKLREILAAKWDKSKIGHASWAEQFKDALYVNGGDDDDDTDGPSTVDYVTHAITVPWKLLFACVPPTDYCGGWVCFFCALGFMGVFSLFMGYVESLMGC